VRDLIGSAPEGLSRGAGWALLGLRVALAAFFVFAATRNLSGDPRMAEDFQRWGYADWFRILVAALQMLGGVLLLGSGTAFYGAIVLGVVLVGAVGTHLLHDPLPSALAPVPFLAATLVVLVAFRPPVLR
jgi:hypothetical protein